MSIRFFINKSKTKVFYLDIGRTTPMSLSAYPITYGIEYHTNEGFVYNATFNKIGKKK